MRPPEAGDSMANGASFENSGIEVGSSVKVEVRYEPKRAGEIHTTWCDISRARKTLGYDPSTSLADGLAATWKWFNDNIPA